MTAYHLVHALRQELNGNPRYIIGKWPTWRFVSHHILLALQTYSFLKTLNQPLDSESIMEKCKKSSIGLQPTKSLHKLQ